MGADRANLVSYFLEGNLEHGRSARTALVVKDRHGDIASHTFGEVGAEVNRCGNALADLGVELEQRVLLALGDSLEFVAAWFATVKIGAVVACVNPLLPASDYAYYLEYSRARVVVCDDDSLPQVLEVLPGARHLRAVLVAGDAPLPDVGRSRVKLARWRDCVGGASDRLAVADTSIDDIAVWLFTSGTTGKPKAAVHFHHDFIFNAEHYAKPVLQLCADDRSMSVPKLFFGYATGSNLLFPFAAGATVGLFQERSRPEAVLEFLKAFCPTVLVNVPTTINGMLSVPDVATRYDLSTLRYITSAGEALPAELYERWKRVAGCEILDGIGSAEMFHVFISNRLGDVKLGSLGRIVDGYRARIVGPDGADVATGAIGTLWIGGASAALCYWNDRAKSRETMRGDWIVTADQFRCDEQGYFWYCGRTDDMLKVGGIWVSPLEIEDCLLAHPAVKECAIVPYPEDDLIKPRAFVVVHAGFAANDALASELVEHVKSRLARYKAPRQVRFLDALPRNDRGKVEKTRLKEMQ